MQLVGDQNVATLYSIPTMILTECVLVYMEPGKSQEVIDWFGRSFHTALFLNYEPVRLKEVESNYYNIIIFLD